MDGEQDRLETMYAEMGDEHLQDMYKDRENLTVHGQMALVKVMQAKGLVGVPVLAAGMEATRGRDLEQGFTPGFPGVVPDGAQAMETALEHGGERAQGMERLIQFYDGLELSRACAALDEALVDFALGEEDRDALSGAPPSHAIWVAADDVTEAQGVLRGVMGLFPEAEVGGAAYGDEWMTLGDFDTAAEAEKVRELLAGAEIEAQVNAEEEGYAVEVKGAELDRGLLVVARGLGVE